MKIIAQEQERTLKEILTPEGYQRLEEIEALHNQAQETLNEIRGAIEFIEGWVYKPEEGKIDCGCDGFYRLFKVHRPGCMKVFD